MAASKPAATRQRRNKTTVAATLTADPATRPDLPPREWHTRTVVTWDTWWASPMVSEWVDADIPSLVELAVLVDDFWRADTAMERAKLRAEIRVSSRDYGLSPMSRRTLQWEVQRVEAAAAPVPAPARARDPRLRSVS